jgi:SAM-dependent methyltransferase
MFGVMFFSDVRQALREMVRVLKTGGTCVVTTWTPRSGVLRPLAAALNAAAPGSPPAQALSSPPVLGTLDELQREFTAAGLSAVEVHEATQVLRLPSRDAYMGELLRANPNGILMEQRLPPQLYSEVRAQVDAQLQAQFGDGPVILEGVANVAAAAKT